MKTLKERHDEVKNHMAEAARVSGRRVEDITLLAVTKTWPAETVRSGYQLGIRHFGENYVQESLAKMDELTDLEKVSWHMIGHLQSNKVKSLVGRFDLIHSVDRLSLAQEISKRTDQDEKTKEPQKILIEVNIANEPSKSGVHVDGLPAFLEEVQKLKWVTICGLMVMPPLDATSEEAKRYFDLIRDERDRLLSRLSAPHSLVELSMGTSHDYKEAIEAGATIVRLGTVLFGERVKN